MYHFLLKTREIRKTGTYIPPKRGGTAAAPILQARCDAGHNPSASPFGLYPPSEPVLWLVPSSSMGWSAPAENIYSPETNQASHKITPRAAETPMQIKPR